MIQQQRIQVSKQYESRLQGIEARLSRIEHMLERRLSAEPSQYGGASLSSTVSMSKRRSKDPGLANAPSEGLFAGDSAFYTQSLHASQVLEKNIAETPMMGTSEIASVLASLRSVLEKCDKSQDQERLIRQGSFTVMDESDIPLPEWTTVLPILQSYHEIPPLSFMTLPYFEWSSFMDMCERVLTDQDFTHSEFVLVTGYLSYLFHELYDKHPEKSSELQKYTCWCRTRFEDAFSELGKFITPKVQNIHALTLGAGGVYSRLLKAQCLLHLNFDGSEFVLDIGYPPE
ncbi:uncharacterized protein ATNIH1004_007437 [Aspergillus tanneri]|uniref:Transcription factor domain-containing protein n=1 Tax=Aspergillus tanneri TaxID=1220188 RepID=A0A5M9MGC5_9EURO|nr:uncharacterized protein ATNIH1004_007437 [Aspergillus tanneri]KAA8646015.1 hypothetical protein ATNIH1004_007437 [Aspergillus tanneri]